MKYNRIFISLIIALVSVILISCDREFDGEITDTGKTQLYVGNFDGGYGEEWLNAVKMRFEEKYKNTSFEPGKEGVQVRIRSKRDFAGVHLYENIASLTQDVFFTEVIYYYDFVRQNLLLDISDVVTSPLNFDFISGELGEGEVRTIESKMTDSHIDFYKTDEGKYFGLPFYQSFYGIIYDVDLFEEEGLFLAKEGEGNSYGFIINKNTPKSAGPDGSFEDDFDNGLPATYEDFFKLLDYMSRKNIEPISWGGGVPQYVNALLTALATDYEGFDQMMLNYTFDGTAKNLVSGFDDNNNPIIYSEEINGDNGYLLLGNQLGRYYALKFLEGIIGNEDNYNKQMTFSLAQSHRSAQDSFISSRFLSNRRNVGMLIDGTWWQNEAKPTFLSLEKAYGIDASMNERRFAYMPLPKVDENHLGKQTKFESNFSVSFINANVDEWKQPLAKAFLQFVHTEESLKEFTIITNTFKPFDYQLNETELNQLSYYGKSLYDIHQNAKFVSPFSKNDFYIKNVSSITEDLEVWNAEVRLPNGLQSFNTPSTAFFNNKVTAIGYFEGLEKYWNKDFWDTIK